MLHQASISFVKIKNDHIELRNPSNLDRNSMRTYNLMDNIPYSVKSSFSISPRKCQSIQYQQVKCTVNVNPEELADEDEELCPVECVREIKKDVELLTVLEKAKQNNALVVVDFYRTSCGSCKYIAQGFAKLCKGSGNEEAAVVFLKHNVIDEYDEESEIAERLRIKVIDEYDEESEIAERLRIKTVPLFHFYKNGILLEAFPTRDKERIKAAILKYTAPVAQNV